MRLLACALCLALFCPGGLIYAKGAEKPPGTGAEAPPTTGGGPDAPPPASAQPPPASPDAPPASSPPAKAKSRARWGLGLGAHIVIIPPFFFKMFTKAANSKNYGVYEPAFGLHLIRRKKNVDLHIRVWYGLYRIKDGNWLGRGHGWDEVDYTEFTGMSFIWAEVMWKFHERIAKNFYFSYGAGIGLGVVIGKVHTTASNGQCNSQNFTDTTVCRPLDPNIVCDGNKCDVPRGHLAREKETIPPVLPAISATIGLRWDIHKHLSWHIVDTGIFIPGFWFFSSNVSFMF